MMSWLNEVPRLILSFIKASSGVGEGNRNKRS